jgi:hypothetical protein
MVENHAVAGLRRDVDTLMKIVVNGGNGTSLSERMTVLETMLRTIMRMIGAAFVVIPALYLLFRWLLVSIGVKLSVAN